MKTAYCRPYSFSESLSAVEITTWSEPRSEDFVSPGRTGFRVAGSPIYSFRVIKIRKHFRNAEKSGKFEVRLEFAFCFVKQAVQLCPLPAIAWEIIYSDPQ